MARLAPAIFLLALAVRLVHLWQIRQSPFADVLLGDARAYDEWAQRLAAGDWIGGEVFYQAPLYPYFLGLIYAAAGRDLTVVRLCQALVGAASCTLVGLAAARLFSRRAGIVAGAGLAIYAPAVFFDGLIQKTVLDVFFVSLTLWLLAGIIGSAEAAGPRQAESRAISFGALGLAMGALSLTRENALVLVAVVLGWIAVRPDARRAAPAFLLGVSILLVPVAVRNTLVGGGFYLTTAQFGPNFYIGNNPGADGTYAPLRAGRGSPEFERQDATEIAERATGRSLTPGEVSAYWTDRALGYIAAEPGGWLALMGRKLRLLVNAGEMLDTESQASYAEWSWPLRATGWFAHFGVLVPLAAIGVWATWPQRRRLAVFYALGLAYAASVLLFYVFARYRFPLVPLLFLFAAAGADALLARRSAPGIAGEAQPRKASGKTRTRTERRPRPVVPAAGVAGLVVLCNWPLLSEPLMQAITETNLGTALYEARRLDDAIARYRRAIALRPDYAPAHGHLGVALRASGRTDEAIAAYERALALQPANPDAHFNLANALLDLNRPQDAAEHFRLAGRQAPASANVENNLGIALAADGKLAEAAAAFRRALDAEPGSARAHRNLGDVLLSLGRQEEGLDHLRRAVELTPDEATFRYDLAVALLEAGRLPDAIGEFRAALAIDPALAPAHNNLGVALGSQGRLDEAIDHFRRALAIQRDYPDARRNLELALQARGAKPD